MAASELKEEISEIVSTLKKEGKIHLAEAISENWQKTLIEYSREINSYQSSQPMEDILKEAFETELNRVGYSKEEAHEIVNYLEKHRILQTSPHISPTSKPRFFFINWLSSLSLSAADIFAVAMFSGIPFSNKTRPGRLSSKQGEINLIPSIMQDELVYRSQIPEKMLETIKTLDEKIKNKLPQVNTRDSYTTWALTAIKSIEGEYLRGKPIFLDFNEIVSNYILLALNKSEHPISKIFFSETERKITIENFKEMVFFYGPVKEGTENFYLRDGYLESSSRKIKLDKETLTSELHGRLCPGLIVGFLIMSFLNHFQCFGSFAQVEYLPLYKEKFAKFPFLKEYHIEKAPQGRLTTGGFPFDLNLHALDIIGGEKFTPDENTLFGEALVAIKDVLLHQNYSMNLIRK